MFKVKDTSAEFNLFVTVVVDDVDHGVRNGEIFEIIEGVGEDDFVAFFVGLKNSGAKVGHFDVVEAKECGGCKK